MFIGLVAGMVAVDSQAMSVRGTNEGTIKHPTVNFVIYLVPTRHCTIRGYKAAPTQQALQSGVSVLVNPSIQKLRTKLIKKRNIRDSM